MTSPSPYAPPASDLFGKPPGSAASPRPPRTQLDISEALKYPFQDPAWLSKAGVAGLMMLVPIVGPFILLGWKVEVYERVKAGQDGLPDINLGPQLSAGFRVFVGLFSSIFLMVMLIMVLHIGILGAGAAVGYALQAISGSEGGMAIGMGAAYLVVSLVHVFLILGVNGLMPEIYRRAFAGDMFALFSPGPSVARLRGRGGLYLLVVVGLIACNLMGAVGMFACYIGMFVSLPLGYAAAAHLVAQWDELSRGE